MKDCYLRNADICQLLRCRKTKASKVITALNSELAQKGYMTNQGQVPREYFAERFNISLTALDAALEGQQATAQAR